MVGIKVITRTIFGSGVLDTTRGFDTPSLVEPSWKKLVNDGRESKEFFNLVEINSFENYHAGIAQRRINHAARTTEMWLWSKAGVLHSPLIQKPLRLTRSHAFYLYLKGTSMKLLNSSQCPDDHEVRHHRGNEKLAGRSLRFSGDLQR